MRTSVIHPRRPAGSDRQRFQVERALRAQRELLAQIAGRRRRVVSLGAEGNDEGFDAATGPCSGGAKAAEIALSGTLAERALAATRFGVPRRTRRRDLTRSGHETRWLDKQARGVAFPELRRYPVSLADGGPEAFADGIAGVCLADLPPLQCIVARADVGEVQQHPPSHARARNPMFAEERVVF